MPYASEPPPTVLQQWNGFIGARITPITSGLINQTFLVEPETGDKAILQRLHPVFSPEVNADLDQISRHLRHKGMSTPHLIPTRKAALWFKAQDGVWRALSHVQGTAPSRLTDTSMAREAGALVGRFHQALDDLDYQYRSGRSHVHDTWAHLQRLEAALADCPNHRLYGQVAGLAESLLAQSADICNLDALPQRHAHGDLKVSNLMFDATGKGKCLIDLDTLTRMHWPLEMGDALRSWCNPRTEDELAAALNLELLQAAVEGYRGETGELITPEEWALLVPGIERICLELSARFLTDALREAYFGWDAKRYASRGEHNWMRGKAMWTLYADVIAKRDRAQEMVDKVSGSCPTGFDIPFKP